MVRPPSPEEEDRRQNSRERKALVVERVKIVNRIKGLLLARDVADAQQEIDFAQAAGLARLYEFISGRAAIKLRPRGVSPAVNRS